MKKTFIINGEEVTVENLVTEQGWVSFTLGGNDYSIAGSADAQGTLSLHSQNHNQRGHVGAKLAKGGHPVFLKGLEAIIDVPSRGRKQSGGGQGGKAHTAPMPGTVQKVLVKAGDIVAAGDQLLVMEAMKLQLAITAAYDGKVIEVRCQPGDLVGDGDLLVKVEKSDAA